MSDLLIIILCATAGLLFVYLFPWAILLIVEQIEKHKTVDKNRGVTHIHLDEGEKHGQ